jgi:hypothetical protein
LKRWEAVLCFWSGLTRDERQDALETLLVVARQNLMEIRTAIAADEEASIATLLNTTRDAASRCTSALDFGKAELIESLCHPPKDEEDSK